MKGHQACLYIPECEEMLRQQVGEDFIENSYRMEGGFGITGLSGHYNPGKVPSLAKVLWNILTRGPELQAGPELTRYILTSSVEKDAQKKEADPSASEIFQAGLIDPLNRLNLKYLFKNFRYYTAEKTEDEFGPDYSPLFNRLFDLRTAAHLHRLILLALLTGHYELFVDGVNDGLAEAIVKDINTWIEWLNQLLSPEEEKLPIVELSSKEKGFNLIYAYDDELGMAICSAFNGEPKKESQKYEQSLSGEYLLFGDRIEYTTLEAGQHLEVLNLMQQEVFEAEPLEKDDIPVLNALMKQDNTIIECPAGNSLRRAWQLAALLQPGVTVIADPDAADKLKMCMEWKEQGFHRVACLASVKQGAALKKFMSNLKEGKYQLVYAHSDLFTTSWFDAESTGGDSGEEQPGTLSPFSNVVLTDLHRISDWGNGFSPEYLNALRKLYSWSALQGEELSVTGQSQDVSYDILNDISRELSVQEEAVVRCQGADEEQLSDQPSDSNEMQTGSNVRKEKEMVDELLTGIRNEDRFHIRIIAKIMRSKFPEVKGLKIGKDRYLYAHGRMKGPKKDQVIMGLLDLEDSTLRNFDKVRKNISQHDALIIMNTLRELVKEYGEEGRYDRLLKNNLSPGIIRLSRDAEGSPVQLQLGLVNAVAGNLVGQAQASGLKEVNRKMILKASEGCKDEEEFTDNLQVLYEEAVQSAQKRTVNKTGKEDGKAESESKSGIKTELPEKLIQNFHKDFYQLRTPQDTLLALYRLKTAGLIDTYETDQSSGTVDITFREKKADDYYESLHAYIRQYFGENQTAQWMEKARARAEKDPYRGWVHTLIDFVDEEISSRQGLKTEYTEEAASGLDDLVDDLTGDDISMPEILDKYLQYLNNPPEPGMSQVSTARKLRDACTDIKEEKEDNFAGVEMLTAFSIFAVDVDAGMKNGAAAKSAAAEEALRLYRNSLKQIQAVQEWKEVTRTMKHAHLRLKDLNPASLELLEPVETEMLLQRTNERLKKFLERTGISS